LVELVVSLLLLDFVFLFGVLGHAFLLRFYILAFQTPPYVTAFEGSRSSLDFLRKVVLGGQAI